MSKHFQTEKKYTKQEDNARAERKVQKSQKKKETC